MGVTEAVGLVLLVVATGCSAVLVAAETSIVHIGRARAEVIGDGLGDDDRVEALLALLDRRSEALRPLVLALVLCRTTTVALVVSWAYQRPGAGWVLPSVAALGLVVFVVAEALPRSVALRRTDTVALRSVGVVGRLASVVPLRWFSTLLAFGLPIATLIFRGFFASIPHEIIEAARIDGCSELMVLWRILAPLAKGAIATVTLLLFLVNWNEFILALVLLRDSSNYTLPLGINSQLGQYTSDYHLIAAASIIASIPIFSAYLLLQTQFERGVAEGALKG